jgi:hypothetical protein
VVGNGKEVYEKILNNPAEMPKDLSFEELLYVPSRAYERKTGKKYAYSLARNVETFSNEEGWGDDH